MPSLSYKSHSSTLAASLLAAFTFALALGQSAMASEEDDLERAVTWSSQIGLRSRDAGLRDQIKNDKSTIAMAHKIEKTNSVEAALKYVESQNLKAPSALLFLTIGRYHDRLDRLEETLAAYAKAIEIGRSKSDLVVFGVAAEELRANKYAEEGQYDKALKDLNEVISTAAKKILELTPVDGNAAEYYGYQEVRARKLRTGLYLVVKDYKQSLAGSEYLIKHYDYLSDGYQAKARVLQAMGRQAEAVATMKQAVAHGANPRLLASLGPAPGESSYESDYKALSAAIKVRKNPDSARQARAELASKNNHPAEALADYQELLKHSAGDEALWLGRGYAYLGLHKYQEAVQDFTRVINADPQHAARAYKGRATAYSALNDQVRAKNDTAKAHE